MSVESRAKLLGLGWNPNYVDICPLLLNLITICEMTPEDFVAKVDAYAKKTFDNIDMMNDSDKNNRRGFPLRRIGITTTYTDATISVSSNTAKLTRYDTGKCDVIQQHNCRIDVYGLVLPETLEAEMIGKDPYEMIAWPLIKNAGLIIEKIDNIADGKYITCPIPPQVRIDL